MKEVNHKIFTLLALREGAAGAQTEEGRRAFQDAFDKRLELIGMALSGCPERGVFVRPEEELQRCGLTPTDALSRVEAVIYPHYMYLLGVVEGPPPSVGEPLKSRSPMRAYKELTR